MDAANHKKTRITNPSQVESTSPSCIDDLVSFSDGPRITPDLDDILQEEQADCPQDRCFAISTTDMKLDDIASRIEHFISFAKAHPDMTFLIARFGGSEVKYTDEQIAHLFAAAYSMPNVFLPASFWELKQSSE